MGSELEDSPFQELLLWLIRRRQRVRVTGASMLPGLKPGQEVLVDLRAYQGTDPQPGDIVVARHPFQVDVRLIKRVKARLEDGRYRLEGDNPLESTDSRTFGPIAREAILGRVTSRFA